MPRASISLVETAALVAASFGAGVNAYLTVILLGVGGRLGWAETPEAVQRPWVMALSAVMFAVEFVVDKVPLLDSAWDLVHTIVRPSVGAALGAAIAGADLGQPQASILAAALSLSAHVGKASTRLAINASPEPFTNIAASLAEDGFVAGLITLAMFRPRLAAGVTVVALVVALTAGLVALRLARRGWRRLRRRGRETPAPAT